ncbi:MAG: galactose-1-phosphate uridylyltransferase [Halobacteriales archaeon]|nr:galactose-1-phosphate uridylyltransferase [Halobacteriales archaeon]
MSELRADRLTDTWVIVAEERAARPRDFKLRAEPKAQPEQAACPFCPGNEGSTPPETFALRDGPADAPGWRVRVVPNKFPALGGQGNPVELGYHLRAMSGVGVHEVIIETPAHGATMASRPQRAWEELALALQHRLRALSRDPRMRYVYAFKNQGPASGASLAHPHSQVLAMPVVPERVRREQQALEQHHRLTERCLLEDIVQEERDAKLRILEEDERFTALCPFASRFPYEMLLAPRAHLPRLEDASREDVAAFGRVLGRCLVRLEVVLQGSPLESYHLGLHTAPVGGKPETYHWHCEVAPSLGFYSGFEKGTGMFVNHLGPEKCAERLRQPR